VTSRGRQTSPPARINPAVAPDSGGLRQRGVGRGQNFPSRFNMTMPAKVKIRGLALVDMTMHNMIHNEAIYEGYGKK
jgi:hypothetical protein